MKKWTALLLALMMCLSLCACGSGGSSSGSAEEEAFVPMHFELDGGILDYKSYEYVSQGFYAYGDGDAAKTICINFDYTNKEDEAKSYMSDFWIRAYQNGVELEGPSSYNPDAAPESYNKAHNTILKDATLTFGQVFTLQDYSPVTVIANQNGGKKTSDPMVLEIEPYDALVSTFDINRLYGMWTDELTGATVTITSAHIEMKNGGSSSWMDDPVLWTDESSLHTGFSNVGEVLAISEENGTLRMTSDKVSLIQTANWPENTGDSAAQEPQTVAMGEAITTDFVEMVFNDSGVKDMIEFSTTSGGGSITVRHTVEPAKDGTQYVYLQGDVKNLFTSAIDPTRMKAKLVINDTYELECKITVMSGSSSIHDLEPMNNATLVLDTGIANDMVGQIEKLVWKIGFDEAFAGSSSGDLDGCKYQYEIESFIN